MKQASSGSFTNDAPAEEILSQIMDAIEQSKKYMMQGAHHWKTKEEAVA